jgi:hypothetical protein
MKNCFGKRRTVIDDELEKLENKFNVTNWRLVLKNGYKGHVLYTYYHGNFYNFEWFWHVRTICKDCECCAYSRDNILEKALRKSINQMVDYLNREQ